MTHDITSLPPRTKMETAMVRTGSFLRKYPKASAIGSYTLGAAIGIGITAVIHSVVFKALENAVEDENTED
jgi:hypothetical protein